MVMVGAASVMLWDAVAGLVGVSEAQATNTMVLATARAA